jgi:hypothetical protein
MVVRECGGGGVPNGSGAGSSYPFVSRVSDSNGSASTSFDSIFRHRVSRYDTRGLSSYFGNFEPVSVEVRAGHFCAAAFAAGKGIFDARDCAPKDLEAEDKSTTGDNVILWRCRARIDPHERSIEKSSIFGVEEIGRHELQQRLLIDSDRQTCIATFNRVADSTALLAGPWLFASYCESAT